MKFAEHAPRRVQKLAEGKWIDAHENSHRGSKPKNRLPSIAIFLYWSQLVSTRPWPALDWGLELPTPSTISIIDDDYWTREGIQDLVSSLGYRTFTFASAEEFLASDCVHMTTCIISDLQMPGLSGLDLQGLLAKWEHRPSIIVMTAYPDEGYRIRALEAGVRGFFVKPLDAKRLTQCLYEIVGLPI
jgi:CheY-like chemotaxis protein